ncbi:unnamed protein product, partial [Meganyctiphanes norvegica]
MVVARQAKSKDRSLGQSLTTPHTPRQDVQKKMHRHLETFSCSVNTSTPGCGALDVPVYLILFRATASLEITSRVQIFGATPDYGQSYEYCWPKGPVKYHKRFRYHPIFPLHFDAPYRERCKAQMMTEKVASLLGYGDSSLVTVNKLQNLLLSAWTSINASEFSLKSELVSGPITPMDSFVTLSSGLSVIYGNLYFHQHQKDAFTCWNTLTNARSTNYGTRIDYIFCDMDFIRFIKDSQVLQDVMGSDHCPVVVTVEAVIVPAAKLPPLCTKFFPEFQGQQQKLSSYFSAAPLASSQSRYKSENSLSLQNSSIQISNKRKSEGENSACVGNKKLCKEIKPKQKSINSFFTSKIKSQSETEKLQINSKSSNNVKEQEEAKENEEILKLVADYERKNTESNKSSSASNKQSWGFLMKGPKPAPHCPGHKEACALRTVKKKGPNFNKQFYACARGAGKEGDPNAQCNFFKWLS